MSEQAVHQLHRAATREEVIRAYKKYLRRAPESDAVINGWLDRGLTPQSLVYEIKRSPEAKDNAFVRFARFARFFGPFAALVCFLAMSAMLFFVAKQLMPLASVGVLAVYALTGSVVFLIMSGGAIAVCASLVFLLL